MKFYKFGKEDNPSIILIHGMLTPWQIWMPHIDHFSKKYYVIVPVIGGHDETAVSKFHSIEDEAAQIENHMLEINKKHIFAVCGLSLGGAISYRLKANGKLNIQYLIMDGAPLCPFGKLLTSIMTKNYLQIVQKSKLRDKKTIENFKKFFLPERFLDSYLKIADNMEDSSVIRAVSETASNMFSIPIPNNGSGIVYVYGTALNELLSKQSAKYLSKKYTDSTVIKLKGSSHCHKAIYEPNEWLAVIESYLLKSR